MPTRHIMAAGDFHWTKEELQKGEAQLEILSHVNLVILAGDIVDQPKDKEHLQLAAKWIADLCRVHPNTEFLFVRGGHDSLVSVKPVLTLEKLLDKDVSNLHCLSKDAPMVSLAGITIAGTNWSHGHHYKRHFKAMLQDRRKVDIFVSHCPPAGCGINHDDADDELASVIKKLHPKNVIFARHAVEVSAFMKPVEELVRNSIACYARDGKERLSIGFGCTGGKHRSVYCAESIAASLRDINGVKIEVSHLARDKWI